MAQCHDVAWNVFLNTLIKGDDFTYSNLTQKIIKKGGILRIMPGFTLGQLVSEYEEDGNLSFIANSKLNNEPYFRVNDTTYVLDLRRSYFKDVSFNPDFLKYDVNKPYIFNLGN